MDLIGRNIHILKEAIVLYSPEHQVKKCKEELFELIVELHKLRPYHIDEGTFSYGLVNELADAYIMLQQMLLIVGEERVQKQVNKKVTRLFSRLWDTKK